MEGNVSVKSSMFSLRNEFNILIYTALQEKVKNLVGRAGCFECG